VSVGYSGTPLQKKLGYTDGMAVAFLGDVPEGFAAQFAGIEARTALRPKPDAAHVFAHRRSDLETLAGKAIAALPDHGMLWVSWPKKSSGVTTDVTENVLRDVLLPTGWVDTKVAAVDEVWSGLKFVKRLTERRTSERAGTPRTRP
jgi:hypothetical protein